jgi:uncharacterized iron-regulated membrane protein
MRSILAVPMAFNVANRKVHHWASFIVAVPLLVMIVSGLFLQMKKQSAWVQPPERRGTGTTPVIGLDQVLTSVQSVSDLGVRGWEDVNRLDVRPGKGMVKVWLNSGWEAQVDLGTGRVLQTAYRRSDLIESIHDGSFFAGDWTKLGLFLPAGLTMLLLWVSGMWMVWVPFIAKRRRSEKRRLSKVASVVLLGSSVVSLAAMQPSRLTVDPIVGHWDHAADGGDAMVVADARKWKTEPATTPFPIAAVRGVSGFSNGVLRVQFKLVAGETDQAAGIAFGITPANEYYYARYNTKDGNVALWQFVNGDRKRILDGADHLQLPLGAWHELTVEVTGTNVKASVGDKLRLEHTLPSPVAGRVGFWTKRDSVSAFKNFSVR